jgi:ribosome-associated heat shock protein Hsp15
LSRNLDRQRIDKWLWHARVVRTRTAATALANTGHVRVNGERIDSASRNVRIGDVVTIALDRAVRVLKVAGFAEARGSAVLAAAIFEDLQPLAPRGAAADQPSSLPPGQREAGSGRPTKRERRLIDQFHKKSDI